MGTISYRANLSAAVFPLTIAEGGRTVIIPGPDNNFDRRVDPLGAQKDAGIPQALYMDNVIPTASGYQSVGYFHQTTGMTFPSGGANYLAQCVELKAKLAYLGSGVPKYILNFPLFIWADGSLTCGYGGYGTVTVTGASFGPDIEFYEFSFAVVRDTCYLYCSSGQLYEVEGNLPGDIELINITATVTPVGFLNNIKAICGSNNYLLAIDDNKVYWSSTTTATDFVSSLVTGAGSISPNNADDALLYFKETSGGFYLYALNDVIYAQYTGNARYPWKFVPVEEGTGIYSHPRYAPQSVYGEADSIGQFSVDANRTVRLFTRNRAESIVPELSDFLWHQKVQATFNQVTNAFTYSIINTTIPTLYVFQNRYLCVSINGGPVGNPAFETGVEKYTHVMIYDIVLKRVGRLKIDHSFIFTSGTFGVDRPNPTVGLAENYLAFVDRQNKQINYLCFDVYQTAAFSNASFSIPDSALVLGKFQYVRSRFISLDEVEIEGPTNTAITPTPDISCVLLPSLDGRNFSAPVPLVASDTNGGLVKYPVDNSAQNVSLAIKGRFDLSTVQLRFHPAGDQ